MFHRSYGETTNCKGCRFWSEMLAKAEGGGPAQAMCLNHASPNNGQYTIARITCAAWKSGHHGAVDEPPDYGEEVRALYEVEEKQ
jgi:hypothetical protein